MSMDSPSQLYDKADARYPVVSDTSDGRIILDDVPNTGSISASVDDYEVLPGIRDVLMSDFYFTGKSYSVQGNNRIKALVQAIKNSNTISPLIIVVENEGPYILEGSHRSEALFVLGAKTFPALVVVNMEEPSITASDFHIVVTGQSDKQTVAPFKSWFENSKAIDEKGPLTLYHGTTRDFSKFETEQPGVNSNVFESWSVRRHGIFFARDPAHAGTFTVKGGESNGGNIIPVHLRIQNPLDLRNGWKYETLEEFDKQGLNSRWLTNGVEFVWEYFDGEDGREFVEAAKKIGYDGVIFLDQNPDTHKEEETWVVFSPNQVKSAIGNKGDYSLDNPDITASSFDIMIKTASSDEEYMKAAESGDIDTCQKMVEEVAKSNGYTIGPVYHGSSSIFDEFSHSYTLGQMGFHFGTESQASSIYGDESPDHVYSVMLNIKNPLRLEDLGGWQGRDVVEMVNETIGSQLNLSASSSSIRSAIQSAGYDGVVYLNLFETPPEESGGQNDSYIAFLPSQIKSVAPITYDTSKNIIPLSKRFNKNLPNMNFELTAPVITTASFDILTKTASSDEEYLKAAEAGDVETCQRMVNEAATSAGYAIQAWHGTRSEEKFTTFHDNHENKKSQAPTGTYFFSGDSDVAFSYAGDSDSVFKVFLKIDNPFYFDFQGADWQGDLYGKFEADNDGEIRYFKNWDLAHDWLVENGVEEPNEYIRQDPWVGYTTNSAVLEAKQDGCDGAVMDNVIDNGSYSDPSAGTVYVVFSPSQIKSAEPVTYDDSGKIIPLSQRFNESNNDMRFEKTSPIITTAGFDITVKTSSSNSNDIINEKLLEMSKKWEADGVSSYAYASGGDIKLSEIRMDKSQRGRGIGTSKMNELISFAQENNMRITLTPSIDFGATSKGRLERFYSRLGFTRNRGRNKDYRTMDSMIWRPVVTENVGKTSHKGFDVVVKTSSLYDRSPIPEGNIRLYHYTNSNADEINKNGIKLSYAKGETYGEPNMIWASSVLSTEDKTVIEFSIPANDPALTLDAPKQNQDLYQWNEEYHHVGILRDIKPSEILAIHEPWHSLYQTMLNTPDFAFDLAKGEFDYITEDKYPLEYKAIQAFKASMHDKNEKPISHNAQSLGNVKNLDFEYMQAAESGDIETCQKMVNEVAEEAVEADFKKHYTGFIPSEAYARYEKDGGLSWLGSPSKYPILIATIDGVEYRQTGQKNEYVKLNEEKDIVRDENGLAVMMSDEEADTAGLPKYEELVVAFVDGKPIGYSSNEFGAVGVWVEAAYQKRGIGTNLLRMHMKQRPKATIGQMTNAGINMTYSYLRKQQNRSPILMDDLGNIIPLSKRFSPTDNSNISKKASSDMDLESAKLIFEQALINRIEKLPFSDNKNRIPNLASIESSLDEYTEYGVRDVPVSWFGGGGLKSQYALDDYNRTKALIEDIRLYGIKSPLIVVVDGNKDGIAYVLEGGHRMSAAQELGLKTVPALVIYDRLDESHDMIVKDEHGNVVPLEKRFASSPDSSVDSEYLAAITSGNVFKAQEMVEQAAKSAGYTIGPAYHGTNSDFNQFSIDYAGKTDDGYYGVGFYFTLDKKTSLEYGSKSMSVFLKVSNPLRLPHAGSMEHASIYDARDILSELYDQPELKTNRVLPEGYHVESRQEEIWQKPTGRTVYVVYPDEIMYGTDGEIYGDEKQSPETAIINFNDKINDVSVDNSWLSGLMKEFDRTNVSSIAQSKGFDAIIIEDSEFEPGSVNEIIVFHPEQIKSASVMVYDDNKNIIPLSQRFDSSSSDIRFEKTSPIITTAQFDIKMDTEEKSMSSDFPISVNTQLSDDDKYMQAAESGDMVTCQRMVDEAAKKAGYTIGPVWHGTEITGITSFDGGWWSAQESTTKEFGRQQYSGYIKGQLADGNDLRKMYIEWNGTDKDPDSDDELYDNEIADIAMSGGPFSKFVQQNGYTGIEVWDDSNAVVDMAYSVFDPTALKSADPITYDDSGNIIPLSQRFNESNNDIRFKKTSPIITTAQFDTKVDTEGKSMSSDFQVSIDNRLSDDKYMQAAKDGDIDTCQRMVDEAEKSFIGAGQFMLFRGLGNEINASYDLSQTDAPIGYSTWTNSKELAQQYAGSSGHLYSLVLPISALKNDYIDADGERALVYNNEKAAGLNGKSGKEFMVYQDHEMFEPSQIKSADPIAYDNSGKIIPLSKRFSNSRDDVRTDDNLSKMAMARPTGEITSNNLYHATSNGVAGEAILRDGFLKASNPSGKHFLAPVKDKLYSSTSLKTASIYALGGVLMGHDPHKNYNEAERYGYIFLLDNNNLDDVQPDEDSVGEILHNGLTKTFINRHYEFNPNGKAPVWLTNLAMRFVSPNRLLKLVDGDYIYFASVGKQLLSKMTEEQKLQLIRDYPSNVASNGHIPIKRAWKLDKMRSKELKNDGSNLFDIAEEVPIKSNENDLDKIQVSASFIQKEFYDMVNDSQMTSPNPNYLYHGTSYGALRHIKQNGLVPKENGQIFLADNETYAESYALRKGNGVMLRIVNRGYKPDPRIAEHGDFISSGTINTKDIEVKIKDGTWVPLDSVEVEFGEINKISSGFDIVIKTAENNDGIIAYHGTPISFDDFSYDFVGKGEDQLGSGFYFTSNKENARRYAFSDSPEQNQNNVILTVRLDIKNPLDADLVGTISRRQIEKLISMSPNLEEALNDYGDVEYEGRNTVLRNTINNFVDFSKGQNIVRSLFPIANDFYKDKEKEFNDAVTKVFGYDGIVKHFPDSTYGDITHYVVFRPSQITILEREPQVSITDLEPNVKQAKVADPNTISESLANTPGSRILDDGFEIEVERKQHPNQAGQPSLRSGVFYQPSGSPSKYPYNGKNGYGGTELIKKKLHVENPIFVKGATGGKAPEAAYDHIKGKGSYEAISNEIMKMSLLGLFGSEISRDKVKAILEKYDGYLPVADNIYDTLKSHKSNGLRYAILENIVANALRKAGYDSIIGYSYRKDKTPFISEVFYLNELQYPLKVNTVQAFSENFEMIKLADELKDPIDDPVKSFESITIKTLQETGFVKNILNNGSVLMHHGTSEKNAKKILSQGKFNGFPFFSPDRQVAEQFSKQAGGKPVVIDLMIEPSAILPISGSNSNYFSARMSGLKLLSNNIWGYEFSKPINDTKMASRTKEKRSERLNVDAFSMGYCPEFAIALNKVTNWPIVVFNEVMSEGNEKYKVLAHVTCLSPNGQYADSKGLRSESEVANDMMGADVGALNPDEYEIEHSSIGELTQSQSINEEAVKQAVEFIQDNINLWKIETRNGNFLFDIIVESKLNRNTGVDDAKAKGHLDTQLFPDCNGTKFDRDVVKKYRKRKNKKLASTQEELDEVDDWFFVEPSPLTFFTEEETEEAKEDIVSVESYPVTIFGTPTKVIRGQMAKSLREYLVLIDADKFDALFRKETDFYIGPNGTVNAIGSRYERFKEFVKKGIPIECSSVFVRKDGTVAFTNGRHRYAVMRDSGIKAIPVGMCQESINNAKKLGLILNYEETDISPDDVNPKTSFSYADHSFSIIIESKAMWGKAGSGVLYYCPEDNSVMLLERSQDVLDPGLWGIPGGAVMGTEGMHDDKNMDEDFDEEVLRSSAHKETEEEVGHLPEGGKEMGSVTIAFGKFKYTTFLIHVDIEQKAKITQQTVLNWESNSIKWFPISNLPKKLHPGVDQAIEKLFG